MGSKDTLLLRKSYLRHVDNLTDEEAGKILRAIRCYADGIEPPEMDRATELVFNFFKMQIGIDSEAYDKVCDQRREAVNKRWGKNMGGECGKIQNDTKNTNVYKCIQSDTNAYGTEIEKENETETEKETETETEKENDVLSFDVDVGVDVKSEDVGVTDRGGGKKTPKPKPKERPASEFEPSPHLADLWDDWLAIRKSRRAGITDSIQQRMVNRLQKFYPNDLVRQREALEKSIRSGWLDVFDPNERGRYGGNTNYREEQRKAENVRCDSENANRYDKKLVNLKGDVK